MTTKNVINSTKYEFQPPVSIVRINSIASWCNTIVSRINIDQNINNRNTNSESYLKIKQNIKDDINETKLIVPDTIAAIYQLKWNENKELITDQMQMAFFSYSQYYQQNLSFKMLNVQIKRDIKDVESPKDKNIDMMGKTDICYDCYKKYGDQYIEVRQCEGECQQ